MTDEMRGQYDIKTVIMDKPDVERAIARIAHELLERNKGTKDLVLIGIHRRGVPLVQDILRNIGMDVPVGTLDITLYRDDLSTLATHPIIKGTDIPFPIDGKHVVIVDDVLYTGRTARAAMDALIDMGRPGIISLAVLIDRGHRELPIQADFVGKKVPTSQNELVLVEHYDIDGVTRVVLCDKPRT